MADPIIVQAARGMAVRLGQIDALTYRPPGEAFQDGEAPITFGSQHPTAPLTVTVTPYLDPPNTTAASFLFVQVRTRSADYLAGLGLTGDIRDTFHDQRYMRLDNLTASRVWLDSFAPLGADKNGRHEWTQNFGLLLTRPVQPLRPREGITS